MRLRPPRHLESATALLLLQLLVSINTLPAAAQRAAVINDSQMSFTAALGEADIPPNIKARLRLVDVRYYSFDGKLHQGQLIINKALEHEIKAIFRDIEKSRFPINKVIPISRYEYDDQKSMLDNNSSAFNYRVIKGSRRLSNHAYGRAVDINPFVNPLIRGESSEPAGATYNPLAAGTLTSSSPVVRAFKRRGWRWGGDWKRLKDYQHFEKPR